MQLFLLYYNCDNFMYNKIYHGYFPGHIQYTYDALKLNIFSCNSIAYDVCKFQQSPQEDVCNEIYYTT